MPRTIHVHQIDAFTRVKFTGNPAGVVLDADALTDTEMLAIARELNNADTAFILKADGPDHDLRVRFFTPRTEAAFVGHASVAAHYVLSTASSGSRRVRQKSRSGVVEVEIRGSDAQRRIAIRQSAPPLGREINDRERLAVMDSLALASADLDLHCPVQVVGAGSTRLMVGVRGPEQLRQLKPDVARLTTLSAQLGAQGFFVFTLAPALPEVLTESRMFCPALGIAEDPVSGNAHGMLGVYLARHGLLGPSAPQVNFAGAQGHHVNRPGRVEVELEYRDGTVAGVWIVGQAMAIFETRIDL
ncbi:MAG TPA: PhzF family phenazine biosynthesis isomerase [Steroidobacteraceae bacterium]|jgi:PhzF family phenazine biosynthesis protein|nr:PhzF family phenazine biosynthesis isomerase [Steroidobacteraceae bacterium]